MNPAVYPTNLHLLEGFTRNPILIFSRKNRRNTDIPSLTPPNPLLRVLKRAPLQPLGWCPVGGPRKHPRETRLGPNGGYSRHIRDTRWEPLWGGPSGVVQEDLFKAPQGTPFEAFFAGNKRFSLGAPLRRSPCCHEEFFRGPSYGAPWCGVGTSNGRFVQEKRRRGSVGAAEFRVDFKLYCSAGPSNAGGLPGGEEGKEENGGVQGITTDLFWVRLLRCAQRRAAESK